MPNQAFLKRAIETNPQISNEVVVGEVEKADRVYAIYFVNDNLKDPAPDGLPWSLEATLGRFESFYILEALPQQWSPCHLFKCNCPECFRSASCVHCILASMVCNTAIRAQATSLEVTIQGWRRRGLPSGKGSEIGDVGEAKARESIELEKEYTLPKVSDLMLLTHVSELSELVCMPGNVRSANI